MTELEPYACSNLCNMISPSGVSRFLCSGLVLATGRHSATTLKLERNTGVDHVVILETRDTAIFVNVGFNLFAKIISHFVEFTLILICCLQEAKVIGLEVTALSGTCAYFAEALRTRTQPSSRFRLFVGHVCSAYLDYFVEFSALELLEQPACNEDMVAKSLLAWVHINFS